MPTPKRVLIIGEDPELVDFSDPAIPPGTNAEKIRTGLDRSLRELRDRHREADLLLTTSVAAAASEVARALGTKPYDCVVVGAGLRIIPKMTPLFEAVMNAVHDSAPGAKLAFNIGPEDSAAAAERQLAGHTG
jgi:ElaB/YqjD/DUF883 family membrane-anchored ribosome-binding protein